MENAEKPKTIKTMTSRERVIKAVNHEPVDRMPIDLGMHYSTGISAFAYRDLREYLGLSTDRIEITDMVQFLARVDEDVLKRFNCDCIVLHPGWEATRRWKPRKKYEFIIPASADPRQDEDGQWIVERKGKQMRMPAGGFFFDGDWPYFEERDEDEVIRITAKEAERIYYQTNYYTMYMSFSGYFSDHPDWLCNMLLDPQTILAQNEQILEAELKRAKKVIDTMGDYIQAVFINADLGAQNAPLCRPSLIEQLSAPFMKEFCSFIHENSDLKVFLHCCGSIKPMIPILIDCGIDILNPVQISAANMDPAELKNEYGDKIAFWGGGCNTQHIFDTATPREVAQNVRELVKIFKPGSGFVFSQIHNIMGNIPPENIVAMFDTAYDLSG